MRERKHWFEQKLALKKKLGCQKQNCILLSIIFIMSVFIIVYAISIKKISTSKTSTTHMGTSAITALVSNETGLKERFVFNNIGQFNANPLISLNPNKSAVKVIPSGRTIGVRLNIDGIFVIGFSDVDTERGRKQSPAQLAGIRIGDTLTDADGTKLTSSRQLAEIIGKSCGKSISMQIMRKNQRKSIKLQPVQGLADSGSKAGLWVRDSTVGVGTLTFIKPNTNEFGALGHPISDVDTELLLPSKNGSIYNSKIVSVEYGKKGKPGELKGMFSKEDEVGEITSNTNEGIYGKLKKDYVKKKENMLLSIAEQDEVKEGPAEILTSIDGSEVEAYSISIERCNKQSKPCPKSMVIRITDERLLKKTGGIVQGMSGSPILQNNKLVGAVTHVFVNKPSMGYGIYIEWMLKNLK